MLHNISYIIHHRLLHHVEGKKVLLLLILSEFLGFLSIFIENEYPFMPPTKDVRLFQMFVCRFLHQMVILFITFYIFVFQTNAIQGHLYLISLMLIGFMWFLHNKCVLTAYELKAYNLDYSDQMASSIPFVTSLFGQYKYLFLGLNALLPMYTVNRVMDALGYSWLAKMNYYFLFFVFSLKYLLTSFCHFLDDTNPIKQFIKHLVYG